MDDLLNSPSFRPHLQHDITYIHTHDLQAATTPRFHRSVLAGRVRAAAFFEERDRLGNQGRFMKTKNNEWLAAEALGLVHGSIDVRPQEMFG
ncbi:hypothetical protein [Aromatoleum petrolei]|uniref:Uncharacterized protein n=1 Tax=Aromatoleum petrolei TaxID=76116 RepID=A0ABX1MTC0_9RHOO|nr:hypothetical protein [Aromatoleum petrolei]NMF89926.1 hypothetical protein [Aromatoleum petrolei]